MGAICKRLNNAVLLSSAFQGAFFFIVLVYMYKSYVMYNVCIYVMREYVAMVVREVGKA